MITKLEEVPYPGGVAMLYKINELIDAHNKLKESYEAHFENYNLSNSHIGEVRRES